MLTESGMEAEAARLSGEGPVSYLPLGDLSRIRLTEAIDSAMRKWQAVQRVAEHKGEVDRILNIDPLTGLLNRGAALRRLEEAMKRAGRFGEQLTVVLVDIDNLGHLNSAFGRGTGDSVLQKVGGILRRRTRDTDIVGRYGGDEFLVVLPHTDKASATTAAERVRNSMASVHVKGVNGDACPVTVSVGLASYEPGDDAASIMYRVEDRLCAAKQRGRNRTEG
jgi:diguanylate cyclase (GGDEF)-like protein